MRKLLLFIIFLLIISVAGAQEQPSLFISNSANWQDVYSVMQYASIAGGSGYFLVSTRHSTLLINQLGKTSSVLIVSSSNNPYVVGYKGVLESRGFDSVDEVRARNINLEMASRLPASIDKFIILDDSYGYNAISVAPYGAISKSYVLFANRRNINQVINFLETRTIDSVLLYGTVDRDVRDRLAQFNPDVINEGDRFQNNIEVVERYQDISIQNTGAPKSQVILTNGEFIEQEIMTGVEPVVFIGRSNVPDQIAEYVRQSDIDIGILIGNELIGTATFIRRELGISVFVKFAQSARAPSSAISPVEDLDRFYLPRYILNLNIFSVTYNRISNTLEVTYQNMVDLASYLKGTITLRWGDSTQVLGDEDPIFIDKSEYKTIVYDKQADGSPLTPMSGDILGDVFTIYGESKNSLEYTLRDTIEVETVSITDNSQIEFGQVLYDKRSGKFLIEIINTGDVDVFVDLELIDLLINDELVTLGPEEVVFIEVGDSAFIEVEVEMDEEDLEDNPRITVRAFYGERERSLIKMIEGEFEYDFTGFGYVTGQILRDASKNIILYLPLVIIVILLLLILGMKKKCPHCDEINNLRSKHCKNCGQEI